MTRDEVQALLPFLANDTLDGQERAEVEAAVAGDANLRAELAALTAIRATMQTEEGYSPGDIGLARLMKDVEKEAPVTQPRRTWVWQTAAAVLLAVVVGQGVFQVYGTDPGGYQLAGETPAFTVSIRPDTRESDLRALLLEAGVEIVGGPSALGLYELALLEGVEMDTAQAILRASDIVEDLGFSDD